MGITEGAVRYLFMFALHSKRTIVLLPVAMIRTDVWDVKGESRLVLRLVSRLVSRLVFWAGLMTYRQSWAFTVRQAHYEWVTHKARLCGHFPFIHCHTERSEDFEVCEWGTRNDLRFFTPLRCVQNDSMEMAVFRVTGKGICVRSDREGALVQNYRINILFGSKTLCVSDVNRTQPRTGYSKPAILERLGRTARRCCVGMSAMIRFESI